jgi:hypothetical protein
VQKGVYYSGIKIFNNLPYGIKNLSIDVIKFKLGRAIAQAVSRQLPTVVARVQTRVWSCGIL